MPTLRPIATRQTFARAQLLHHAVVSVDPLEAILSEVGRLPEDSRMVRTEMTEEHTARLTVRVAESGPTGRQFAAQLGPILEQLESTDVDWEVGSSVGLRWRWKSLDRRWWI